MLICEVPSLTIHVVILDFPVDASVMSTAESFPFNLTTLVPVPSVRRTKEDSSIGELSSLPPAHMIGFGLRFLWWPFSSTESMYCFSL